MNIEDMPLTEQTVAEFIKTLYHFGKPSASVVLALLDRISTVTDSRTKLALLVTAKQNLTRDLKPLAIASLRVAEKQWAEKI